MRFRRVLAWVGEWKRAGAERKHIVNRSRHVGEGEKEKQSKRKEQTGFRYMEEGDAHM